MPFFSKGLKKATKEKTQRQNLQVLEDGVNGTIMELTVVVNNLFNLSMDLTRLHQFEVLEEVQKVITEGARALNAVQNIYREMKKSSESSEEK